MSIPYTKVITLDKNEVHGKRQKIGCAFNESTEELTKGFYCGIYSTISKKIEEPPKPPTIGNITPTKISKVIFSNVVATSIGTGTTTQMIIGKQGNERGKPVLLIDGDPFLHCGVAPPRSLSMDNLVCWASDEKDFFKSMKKVGLYG